MVSASEGGFARGEERKCQVPNAKVDGEDVLFLGPFLLGGSALERLLRVLGASAVVRDGGLEALDYHIFCAGGGEAAGYGQGLELCQFEPW